MSPRGERGKLVYQGFADSPWNDDCGQWVWRKGMGYLLLLIFIITPKPDKLLRF